MLTEKDLQQLSERNITENQVINQVAQLKRGTQYVQLMRPATLNDGILRMDEEQVRAAVKDFLTEIGLEKPTPRDMGKTMKPLLAKLEGRADGGLVSRVLKDIMAQK